MSLVGDDLTALYGLDTTSFGFGDTFGGPTIDKQIVTVFAPDLYLNGLFGLNHQATNLTDFADPHPSVLTTLRSKEFIPSLSWAYTAGAQYRRSNFSI